MGTPLVLRAECSRSASVVLQTASKHYQVCSRAAHPSHNGVFTSESVEYREMRRPGDRDGWPKIVSNKNKLASIVRSELRGLTYDMKGFNAALLRWSVTLTQPSQASRLASHARGSAYIAATQFPHEQRLAKFTMALPRITFYRLTGRLSCELPHAATYNS